MVKISMVASALPRFSGRAGVLLLLPLFLSACITGTSFDVPSQTPAEVENRVVIDGEVLPLPEERTIQTHSMPNQVRVSPVVRNLMSLAEKQRQQGDLESAANSLERAMRIEPRNASLWNRLADVRYEQELWTKSIQLAAKSNTLAGGNKNLRRRNWHLMANAYRATGNIDAETKFREKLRR